MSICLSKMMLLFLGVISLTSSNEMNDTLMIQQLADGNYSIKYEDISYLIDPDLGGRIISAKLGESELLLQERDSLVNWGSTFWLAPQKLWNWPPPMAMHQAGYKAKIEGNHLQMISDIDEKFGVRAKKDFHYNRAKKCLEIQYTIINESDATVQYGPWEVTVVPAVGSSVCFALGDEPQGTRSNLAFEDHDGVGWYTYDHEKASAWHKTFNNAKEGWLAHINADRTLFVKKFDVIPSGNIARGQGNVEVYVSKDMRYIELENHGRYTSLEPGASLTYKVSWYLSKLPEEISSKAYSEALLKLIRGL